MNILRKSLLPTPFSLGLLVSLGSIGFSAHAELTVASLGEFASENNRSEWMRAPVTNSPRIVWLAVNSGYVVFDPDRQSAVLPDNEVFVLVETTPFNDENIYPMVGNQVRKVFDHYGSTRRQPGIYVYRVKKCDAAGCAFVGDSVLVQYVDIAMDSR